MVKHQTFKPTKQEPQLFFADHQRRVLWLPLLVKRALCTFLLQLVIRRSGLRGTMWHTFPWPRIPSSLPSSQCPHWAAGKRKCGQVTCIVCWRALRFMPSSTCVVLTFIDTAGSWRVCVRRVSLTLSLLEVSAALGTCCPRWTRPGPGLRSSCSFSGAFMCKAGRKIATSCLSPFSCSHGAGQLSASLSLDPGPCMLELG